ncbi:MAG: hypothetical protein R3320_06815 [Nitriliruptorales bacterium]|nr:hypothetical protein [Nitriliruptorales bacterium]
MGELDPGLKHEVSLEVTSDQTAEELGSGDVPVLGTPAVLSLAECACVEAIAGSLPEGQTSVGTFAEIEHDKATVVGRTIRVEATLVGHHGRRLEFNVLLREGDEIVAKVRHRRVLVDRQRFLEKCGAA